MYVFARGVHVLPTGLCPVVVENTGGHLATQRIWSMIKRLDIIEPHVTLLCAPRSTWVVLREDRLAH